MSGIALIMFFCMLSLHIITGNELTMEIIILYGILTLLILHGENNNDNK